MSKGETFGQRIKFLRKGKGLDQRTLAAKVEKRLKTRGFDFTYLSKIENSRMPPPSTEAILALARELDTNPDELLALAKKAPPDLGEMLKNSPIARTFFRSAKNLNLTETDWQKLVDQLRKNSER